MIPLVHQEVLSHRVSLRLELAPTLPAVLGDRVQLQQVIINLIVNGMEAMASVTDRPRELVVRSQLDDSGQVLVAVQDSGVGIDPENAKQALQRLLHHQAQRHGHGAIDLPLDHREPWRDVVGLAQCRAWRDVSVHLAVASGGPLVTRPTQEGVVGGEEPIVFIVEDDTSLREALSSLFRTVGLRTEIFGSAGELLQNKLPDVPACLSSMSGCRG